MEKPIEPEIVESKDQALTPAIVEDSKTMLTERYVESAGKQIDLRIKLLNLALKALKPHDLQDFDNKPYLEGEGAARIMAVIRGFKVGEAKFVIENIAPHYFIEASIPMEFMGATTVAIGDCSTADPFFVGKDGHSGQFKRHLDRTGSEIMAARMMLGDAKKKARENAISRGVSELLGIKGLTWDDLAKLGFSRTGAGASIAFKGGSQNGTVKNIGVTALTSAAPDSVVNVTGKVVEAKERTVKGDKAITDYYIEDEKAKAKISAWGNCIEGLQAGVEVFFDHVEVTQYQNSLQFLAKSVSIVGVDNGNIDQEH